MNLQMLIYTLASEKLNSYFVLYGIISEKIYEYIVQTKRDNVCVSSFHRQSKVQHQSFEFKVGSKFKLTPEFISFPARVLSVK